MKRMGETFNIDDSILRIVGEFREEGKPLKYIFECDKCSLDKELFPYGTIKTVYANVARKKQKPCACSTGYRYTEAQNVIRVSRYCETVGYKFLGWEGRYNKDKSYLKLYNTATGNTWTTTTMNNLFRGYGDPVEARQNTIKGSLVDDEVHIAEFFKTGSYHLKSKFTRLEGRSWGFKCGDCGSTYVRCMSGFKKGKDPCGCSGKTSGYSKAKPANLYIVRWYGYGKSYLKFGITNQEVLQRIIQQFRKAKLDYEILHTFHHPSGQCVWDCERSIKQSMQTSVCPKEWLPDGFSETVLDTDDNLTILLNHVAEYLKEE